MPTFNFYSAWMDPVFYAWAAAAAAGLVALIYSIRRYLELKNASFEDELAAPADLAAEPAAELPALAAAEQPDLPAEEPGSAAQPEPALEQAPPSEGNRAETFVRGIFDGISGLDARLKDIEAALSKGRVNGDFTVKFLEDLVQDIDALDKQKIKARIEYLLSDLKK
ncbi:MAG: hypothetical protein NDI60_06035 [Elusimicrobiales bacterium]|nr:hypothetical protein [Elusimicrobiales bacterium]